MWEYEEWACLLEDERLLHKTKRKPRGEADITQDVSPPRVGREGAAGIQRTVRRDVHDAGWYELSVLNDPFGFF